MSTSGHRPIRPWIERLWRVFGDGVENRGVYVPSRDSLRMIPDNESLFGEQLIASRRTVIALNSAFGVSDLRHIRQPTGTGSVREEPGKIVLSTGTTTGSGYKLATAEVGTYEPGHDAEIGIGVRPRSTFQGTAFARWGGLSASGADGFYFKRTDGDLVEAVRRKADVEVEITPRDQWNLDRFDGSGDPIFNKSLIDLNLLNGYIYQVDFTWYGYGIIAFGIVRNVANALEKQRFIPGHVMQINGDISINEPNLQIFAEVNNGDQATDFELDLGGMQYAVLGPDGKNRRRNVDDYVTGVSVPSSGAQVHLLSFRRKSDFVNRSVEIRALDLVATNQRVIVEVYIGGSVTGTTFLDPTGYTPSETSVEVIKEDTFDNSDAILVDRFFVEAGGGVNPGDPSEPLLDLDLPDTKLLTFTARTESGNNATMSLCQAKLSEGW